MRRWLWDDYVDLSKWQKPTLFIVNLLRQSQTAELHNATAKPRFSIIFTGLHATAELDRTPHYIYN